jgi:hypothetical protein
VKTGKHFLVLVEDVRKTGIRPKVVASGGESRIRMSTRGRAGGSHSEYMVCAYNYFSRGREASTRRSGPRPRVGGRFVLGGPMCCFAGLSIEIFAFADQSIYLSRLVPHSLLILGARFKRRLKTSRCLYIYAPCVSSQIKMHALDEAARGAQSVSETFFMWCGTFEEIEQTHARISQQAFHRGEASSAGIPRHRAAWRNGKKPYFTFSMCASTS